MLVYVCACIYFPIDYLVALESRALCLPASHAAPLPTLTLVLALAQITQRTLSLSLSLPVLAPSIEYRLSSVQFVASSTSTRKSQLFNEHICVFLLVVVILLVPLIIFCNSLLRNFRRLLRTCFVLISTQGCVPAPQII